MIQEANTNTKSVFSEEDLNKIEALPAEHKSKIYNALKKHFQEYDDLLRNISSFPSSHSIPQKDDL